MSCAHCENAVKGALSALEDVSGVAVSLEGKTVIVDYGLDIVFDLNYERFMPI